MSDNLLLDFFSECREHLEGIESDLLEIEDAGDKADQELINKVFRAAHSIKGGSSFFNLEKVKQLAHRTETVLDMIRSHKMSPLPEVINILLSAFDQLRNMINNPDNLDDYDISSFIDALQDLASQYLSGDEKKSIQRDISFSTDDNKYSITIPEIDFQIAEKDRQYIYILEYDLIHDIDRSGKSAVEVLNSLSMTGVIIDTIFDIQQLGTLDESPANEILVNIIYRTVLDPAIVDAAVEINNSKIHMIYDPKKPDKQVNTSPLKSDSSEPVVVKQNIENNPEQLLPEPQEEPTLHIQKSSEEVKRADDNQKSVKTLPDTIRINVESLDMLMSQAGELVLSRNQLIDSISRNDTRAVATSAQRLSFVISELQEAVMQTRLQPVGNVFNKFPRLVRDMAMLLKKDIRLIIEGKDVDLDKTIIEGLSDPLTHMVRNAADHGIEHQNERINLGKSPTATISLKAFHEAGHVVIEVEDDGKGIDSDKVIKKALSLGLINKEQLKGMTDYDKISLIFLPGLSTADKLTDTSGRGVGMDVVKTNLDRLGGKVTIRSNPGKGTSFRIILPLTLAIIPSLIIAESGERFAIPQVNVVELLRLPAAQVKERVQIVGTAEVVVLRGEFIPIVRFSTVLGLTKTYTNPETGATEIDRRQRISDRRSPRISLDGDKNESQNDRSFEKKRVGTDRRFRATSDLNIVIISSGLLQYGLVVDQLKNTEEIVVKPVGLHLKGLQEYAGATIMGDGEIALILDATGIALKANISSVSAVITQKKNIDETIKKTEGQHSLLLFNNQINEECAIPLDLVQRVERITYDQIESIGGIRTMQYRDSFLPLVQLSDIAKVNPVTQDSELVVVVTSVAGHDVGVLGCMPVSVLESDIIIDTFTHRQKGITGSLINENHTILIINLFELINEIHPEWSNEKKKTTDSGKVVLLAEDSDFFRDQVEHYLQEAGYTIISAKDGLEAWELLQANFDKVKIIVTDIEMPRMTGIEFCATLRKDKRFSTLPVIALTSLAGEDYESKGKEAGITDYQVKLDRDRLIEGIEKYIG